ncbi:MAG TPA: hypothetical protein VIM65_17620 [Cyclobacteriaceae bacterium]
MWETILKITSVYFASMLKFIFGPVGGYAAGLNLITTVLTTVAGMMTIVVLFTFGGNWLRQNVLSKFSRKSKFHISNKRFVTIWKKYGLVGVAILTPLILTPIGGTILAISSGSPKDKIIVYMFISAAAWSLIFSGTIYIFGNEVLKVLPDIFRP